jgi:hypothetical protein
MTTVLTSQYTTPNLTVDAANGTAYVYRRYRKASTVPVIFFQHFRGNLDNWDPALRPPRRHRRRAGGHPVRRRRRRAVERHGTDVVRGLRARRARLHRRARPHRSRPLRLLHRRVRRPGGRSATPTPGAPHDPSGNRTPGWSGNARLDRRSPRPRHEGHPRGRRTSCTSSSPRRRVADESGEGHAVRRSDLHPNRRPGRPLSNGRCAGTCRPQTSWMTARSTWSTAHCSLAERGNFQLKTTFTALRRVSLCPWRIGAITAAAIVMLHQEHDRTT